MVDADGASSDPFILMVMVKPMNTLAPVVTTNSGLQLFEGQSRPLRADRNLQVSDENNLQDVRVSGMKGCRGWEWEDMGEGILFIFFLTDVSRVQIFTLFVHQVFQHEKCV